MKKPNPAYKTHLLRILAILCLLSSYLWIAPSRVHASQAGSRDDVLGKEQTYMTGEAMADNQMAYHGPWKNGYEAGLLNPVQITKEQTQPQTFGLSLEEYLWPTDPLQTDNLSLSISKGGVPQAPGESNPSAPLQQVTTLEVDIISSPWAALDSNGEVEPGAGGLPGVFVVEAVVTNTGSATATGLVVTLDYDEDPSSGWILLAGENPVRTLDGLASGASHYVYWFARYPHDIDDYPSLVTTHQYTVTADAANASSVATAENFYEPDPSWTVQTRSTIGTGNSVIAQSSAEVIVGVVLTLTQVYSWTQEMDDTAFSPVGNVDFDPRPYRLVETEVHFLDEGETQESIFTDRLYFSPPPTWARKAEVTYTFLALLPENATLCPYAALHRSPNPKYDKFFCSDETKVVITGTLTLSQTKQVSSLTIEQGQLLTYTINYTNTGDRPLQYAWIWDDISATLASVVADSITPAPAIATDSRVAWYLGTIPESGQSGSTGTRTFAILVDGDGQDLADNTSLVNHAFFGVNIGSLPTRPALTSTVTTTLHAPMIALSKTDGREIAQPESLLTYTLRVTNSGSIAASGLVITDELPAGVNYTSGTATPPETSRAGQILVWDDQGPIAPDGGTVVIAIPVTVNSDVPDGTTLVNTATVTYQNASGQHTFATEIATDTTIIQTPVLTITKTARDVDGPPLVVGDEILYTLQVTNTGTYTAYNVIVTDDLPDQVTCQDVSGDSAPLGCADPLVWSIPSLATDATASLYITVTINDGSEGQTITNTASVTGENVPDPPDDPTPVCPDGSHPVGGVCPTTPEPRDTELAFTKTAEDVNGPPLVVSDTIRYTLQVTNIGTYTAYDVTVTDDLPNQVTCQDVSGDSPPAGCADPLVWNIPSLAIDATASLYIDVTINPDSAGQTITNTGSVTGTNVPDPPDDPPPVCPDGSYPVGGVCPTPVPTTTLDLTKTAEDVDGPPLVVGDEILYTLQVTNIGDHTAYDVTVTDDLPNQVTCQEVSGDSAPADCADPLVWSISSLAADATASLYITVTINDGSEGQTIINTASVTGTNVPDPPDDPSVCPDGSTPVGGVCPTPDPRDTELAFTKTARDVNGGYLVVGDEVLYTLQVTNIGTYTAYDVTVTDDLPNQVTCQDVSGDSAPAGCADPLVWNIPSLAIGDTAFLYVTVTINPGSEGQSIINTGSVTGTNVPDPPDDPTVCPDGSIPVNGVCPNTPVPTTTLALTKTAEDVDGPPLVVGDEILYTLQVTNTGSHTAYNVTVTDDLPDQVTCQAVSGDSAPAGCADPLVWNIPSLAAGGTASLYITVTINDGSEGQTIINTASVTGENVPNPPDDPSVCPDGSTPVNGVCPTPVAPPPEGGIYLPIITKG